MSLAEKTELGENSQKKEGSQKTILDYNMGFRTRSRSSSVDSHVSIDNYATKKRKLKTVKEEVVSSLQKAVEDKESQPGALVIAENEAETG